MAMQIQNVIKNSLKIAGVRSISSGSGILAGDNLNKNSSNGIHLAVQRDYPMAASLPLPPNVDPAETTRFSPLRNRDINGSVIIAQHSNAIDITLEQVVETHPAAEKMNDQHLECHDQNSPVSLNAVMQTQVPDPFSPTKFSHLNMPGGGWMQQSKFLSHELFSSHYTNLRQEIRSNWCNYTPDPLSTSQKGIGICGMPLTSYAQFSFCKYFLINKRFISQSTKFNSNHEKTDVTLTRAQQLKKAVKDYGSTVIVFHVFISLCSLGICYVLVSSGLDVVAIVDKLGLGEHMSTKVATNASTFVLAYAFHKLFAPARIGITLSATPFIVRYLRSKGILRATKH